LTASGAVPFDVGNFVKDLRNHPNLRKTFSTVESTGLRKSQMGGAAGVPKKDAVSFSVICQSNAKGK